MEKREFQKSDREWLGLSLITPSNGSRLRDRKNTLIISSLYTRMYLRTSSLRILWDKNGGSTSRGRCSHPFLTSQSLFVSLLTFEEIVHEPTYRWVDCRLLSLVSSLIAQPTRYRPLHSDVRAYPAARVNERLMATT